MMMNPYASYYVNQVGSGLPGFQGIRYQRGHGFFGRLLSGAIMPFLKQVLPSLGKRILPSFAGLAQDIVAGENVKQSAISRLKEAGTNVADESLEMLKSKLRGSGRGQRSRKRRRSKAQKSRSKSKKAYKKKRKRSKSVSFL